MNYAYVRVSTKEQSETRQIECLKKYDIDKWYSEKISGEIGRASCRERV